MHKKTHSNDSTNKNKTHIQRTVCCDHYIFSVLCLFILHMDFYASGKFQIYIPAVYNIVRDMRNLCREDGKTAGTRQKPSLHRESGLKRMGYCDTFKQKI